MNLTSKSKSRLKKIGGVALAALVVGLWNISPAYAYISRTDQVGAAGTVVGNSQIQGGDTFTIYSSTDPNLSSYVGSRYDLFKYAPDGAPISNGNDTDGGVWLFDHIQTRNSQGQIVSINSSNGYKQIGISAASQWINALKGNSSFVQSNGLYETDFQDTQTGQIFRTYSLSWLADESGASFQGNSGYNATVYATNPPTANSVSATVNGSTVTLAFNNSVPLWNGLATHHYDQITIRNSSGQVVWQPTGTTNAGVSNVQVEGGSQYSGESDVITPSYSFSAGTYTVTASVWDGVDRQSNTVTTTFTVAGSGTGTGTSGGGWSVSLRADQTSLNTGQTATLTATANQSLNGSPYWLDIYDETSGQWIGQSGAGTTAQGTQVSYTAASHTFIAYVGNYDSTSNAQAQSNPVTVTWNSTAPLSVTISANPTSLNVGSQTTVTATAPTVPSGDYVVIWDETTGQELNRSLTSGNNVSASAFVTEWTATTHQFIAQISPSYLSMNQSVAQSSPVSVTWNQPQPQPSGGGWQCGPNDSDTLTWWAVVGDSMEQFQATYNTTVDQGVVSGLLDDPGTPSDMWLPIPASEWNTQAQGSGFWAPLDQEHGWTGSEQGGPNASQVVRQFSDGNELVKIFGSPEAGGNPMVYARPDSAFGLRLVWTGSPHSMPTSGTANFTMTNPDGSFVTWSEPITIDTATEVNQGDTPNGTQAPPYATEAVSVFTTIPKFTFPGGVQNASSAEPAAWSLSNNPETVAQNSAHISVTLNVTNACGTSSHTINNVATLFNFPDFYLIQLTGNNFTR